MSLPPTVWADLFYAGSWNTITRDVRAAQSVSVTRGLSSESASTAEPVSGEITLNNRERRYSPRDPDSVTFGAGRNTPIRYGYYVGSPWAELSGGTDGDAIETPDDPVLDVTGDFDLRVEVALEDWSESQMLALRYFTTGDQRAWALEILDGIPTFLWSPDGLFASRIDQAATEGVKAYNGQRLALRVTLDVDNGAGGYELRFYTGRTVDDDEADWHLLGDPITGASTTSIAAVSAPLEFGSGTNFNQTPAGGVLDRLRGKAFALKLLSGIAGTTAVSMSTAAGSPGARSFTDDTGLVWSTQADAYLSNKHIRLSGEVPEWPATRDQSGNESRIALNPAGVTRRMDAGNKPQDSALLRYIKAHDPIECWPLTDGEQTDAQGGSSLVGGRDMTYQLTTGSAVPEWQAGQLADWVEKVINFKAETTGEIKGIVPNSTSAAAAWSVDLFLSGGGQGAAGTFEINDRGAYTDTDNRIRIQVSMDANADSIKVLRASLGDTSSSGALLASISSAGIFNDDQPHHIRVSLDPGASSTGWALYLDGVSQASGTMTSIVVKAVRDVAFNWSLVSGGGSIDTADQRLGFVTYWDGTGPPAADIYDAYTGFQGEKAGARIERLASESGYTATTAGESVYQRPMGIQGTKKLLELLNEANKTNFGYLVEARDRNEVIHRGQSTLWNQPPALTIDFAAGLVRDYKYRDDDLLTENDVSVKREYGSVPSRQVLESGGLSVQDYPDGVGRYDKEFTYSLYEDADAAQTAYLRLHLGTYNGVRFTKLTLDLANPRVFQMIDAILRADCGDLIRLTNVPAEHGPDDVDILVNGYSEASSDTQWQITFVGVPGEPWTAGVVDSSAYGRADTDGSELAEALDVTQTDVDVLTTGQARWVDSATYPDDFPFDVRTGGEVMTVTAVTGALEDQFDRTVTSGWGTADTGETWTTTGGSASDYSVQGM